MFRGNSRDENNKQVLLDDNVIKVMTDDPDIYHMTKSKTVAMTMLCSFSIQNTHWILDNKFHVHQCQA